MDFPPSHATDAESGSADYRPPIWANKDAWDGHRALISHLYAEKPLPEVMRTMEVGHGFRATLVVLPTNTTKFHRSLTQV